MTRSAGSVGTLAGSGDDKRLLLEYHHGAVLEHFSSWSGPGFSPECNQACFGLLARQVITSTFCPCLQSGHVQMRR